MAQTPGVSERGDGAIAAGAVDDGKEHLIRTLIVILAVA